MSQRVTILDQRAFVHVLKVHEKLLTELAQLLKPFGISEPQYNVLRILRGAADEGLPCRSIAERMITKLPDITRLLDRLELSGLVVRKRSKEDRRVVRVRIRESGLTLLSHLDRPVGDLHQRQFKDLEPAELEELIRILKKVRNEGERNDPDKAG